MDMGAINSFLMKYNWVTSLLLIVFVVFVIKSIIGDSKGRSIQNNEIEACVTRGIAYFKEIGAYPTLTTTGENAEQVAKERCYRTTTAF